MRVVLHANVQKPWFRLPASLLLKADKQTIHNCWGFGEYAEIKTTFPKSLIKLAPSVGIYEGQSLHQYAVPNVAKQRACYLFLQTFMITTKKVLLSDLYIEMF